MDSDYIYNTLIDISGLNRNVRVVKWTQSESTMKHGEGMKGKLAMNEIKFHSRSTLKVKVRQLASF